MTMLIFTRKLQQVVTIGDDIKIEILGVKGNQVRVGITAPKEVAVHREEVYDRIKQETDTENDSRERPVTATAGTTAGAAGTGTIPP